MTTKVPASMLSGSGAPAARATSSPISIPTGTGTFTPFTSYGTPDFNETGAFNPATGRFTPQVAGWYQANVSVNYLANSVTAGYVAAVLRKNGATYAANVVAGSGASLRPGVSDLVYLNGSTDYLDVTTAHTAAGSLSSVSATLSAALVRPA